MEFLEKYLCIELENEKIMAIVHDYDADHLWSLEKFDNKKEKMIVFCESNLMSARNIPEFLLDCIL